MKKLYTSLLLLLLSLAQTTYVFAGWPVGKKRYLVGGSVYTYLAKNYWDQNGRRHSGDGNKFSSYSLGIYADYGISRKLDLVLNVPISYQSLVSGNTTIHRNGPGDLHLGLNYALAQFDLKNYISVYGGVIVPLYPQIRNQTLGYAYNGVEARAANTGNLKLGSHNGYYNIEAGYRKYLASDGPSQLLYQGTFGYYFNKYNVLLVDVAGTDSASPNHTLTNFSGSTLDYRETHLSLDYGYTVSRRLSIYASGFYTITGRNIGQAYGNSLQFLFRL